MIFDIGITERDGNGGDIQLLKNDLAIVNGIENMIYLAMFGGNVEQSTTNVQVSDAKDWWGNNLFMKGNPSIQFNSETERTLNTTELTSAGRVKIEEAIKKDLQFLAPQSTVTVTVTIVATDRININIRIITNIGSEKIIIIELRKTTDGDWVIEDFNNDFLL